MGDDRGEADVQLIGYLFVDEATYQQDQHLYLAGTEVVQGVGEVVGWRAAGMRW